ncbi:hypothetical protein CO051_06100 [Candidatus Roizmanbacteria bacterium CG_4_9_14_0_2_um_filter_39_13]|uniref:Uncharacterized protein n=2 Tax=Candidatus Roizmaniibacteriota TaxID=1752723 RepID=A0A2M8EX08_9BACT|nr:MAG: hypothetical protein COY15_04565 [Candidatus Roizmanbacteria bacterium CG_4_10_14_0_2_um_filter_39_12]PJC30395.1 MAG: hypothetical protein CO051_06100 [Candidatus Roizmanbacteria bacterium CG_4_9_14_0_2_um_filter_39_13]PJE61324.1 MAG: hypothetical protein COU87_05170 [Candidatus Roizmanbacteria bacterium CG10_big_fil_rev_8_21_14_0_10_39_12]
MSPDTQQNIFYTAYFIITHNALAFVYSAGILFVTTHMLWRPKRGKVLILWGLIILLFAFEYSKHILEPLRQQTIQSLITERESVRIEFYINKFLTKIVPFGLPIFGWFLIGIGFYFDTLFSKVRKFIIK